MKKFILILCLIFLTSCVYTSEQPKDTLSLTVKESNDNQKINAIILYVDLENEKQENDYGMFNPKSDIYIGTNDYIITSNVGFGISKNILSFRDSYKYGNQDLFNLDIDVGESLRKDLINDAYELVDEIRARDYLYPPKSWWWWDSDVSRYTLKLYDAAHEDHGSPQLQSHKRNHVMLVIDSYENDVQMEKYKEILLSETIPSFSIDKLKEYYVDYAKNIITENNNARIWFSIPRYDKFLPYSKYLTDYYKEYFIDDLLRTFSETNTIHNIAGFCFETEQLNDYKYYVFDKTKLNNDTSVISEKYKNRDNILDEIDYGNETLNSLVDLSDYIHEKDKTFIWIPTFTNQDDKLNKVNETSNYSLEIIANQTDIFDQVLIQPSMYFGSTTDYNKQVALSTKNQVVSFKEEPEFKKTSDTVIGFEYELDPKIDTFENLYEKENAILLLKQNCNSSDVIDYINIINQNSIGVTRPDKHFNFDSNVLKMYIDIVKINKGYSDQSKDTIIQAIKEITNQTDDEINNTITDFDELHIFYEALSNNYKNRQYNQIRQFKNLNRKYPFAVYIGAVQNLNNPNLQQSLRNIFTNDKSYIQDLNSSITDKNVVPKTLSNDEFYKVYPIDGLNLTLAYEVKKSSSAVINYEPIERIGKKYSFHNQMYFLDKQYIDTYLLKDDKTIKIADFELKHDTINIKHQLENSLLLYFEKSEYAREYYDLDLNTLELKPHIFIDGINYRVADFYYEYYNAIVYQR